MTGGGKELVYIVECQDCKRQTLIDLKEMAERLDNIEALEKLKARFKCRCGSTRFSAQAIWWKRGDG